MNTFEQVLTLDAWVEILNGGTEIAFELIGAKEIRIFFNESATPPSLTEDGNAVLSFPAGRHPVNQ